MNLAVSFVVKNCNIVAYGSALMLFKVIVSVGDGRVVEVGVGDSAEQGIKDKLVCINMPVPFGMQLGVDNAYSFGNKKKLVLQVGGASVFTAYPFNGTASSFSGLLALMTEHVHSFGFLIRIDS